MTELLKCTPFSNRTRGIAVANERGGSKYKKNCSRTSMLQKIKQYDVCLKLISCLFISILCISYELPKTSTQMCHSKEVPNVNASKRFVTTMKCRNITRMYNKTLYLLLPVRLVIMTWIWNLFILSARVSSSMPILSEWSSQIDIISCHQPDESTGFSRSFEQTAIKMICSD